MSTRRFLATLLVALMAVSLSAEAWARAGSKSSLGSRGSRTYDRPIERTITAPPKTTPDTASPGLSPSSPTSQPMYNPGAVRSPAAAAAAPAAMAQPGFFQRNPFLGGIMGGLVGAGIGSMLFGHSPAMAAASTAAPGASMLGMLLQIALIGGLGFLAYRLFKGRAQAPAPQAPGADGQGASLERGHLDDRPHDAYDDPRPLPNALGRALPRAEKEFEVGAADQQEFTRIIDAVQKAWSDGNPVALRKVVTPEVAGWIGEDLARDQSKGLRNVVEDVTLLKGDVTESWRDGELEFATALITFTARDYMVRLSDNQVVEGDPRTPQEATEAWTFVRTGANGQWLLSAIEQV